MQIHIPEGTRARALRLLYDFVPRAGRAYAAERNYDRGPGNRSHVSTLAPYVRSRSITEEEVLRAVLERFRYTSASKFVQEVFWRTYWKGWLESRPAVWHDYCRSVVALYAECEADPELAAAYERATSGRTGIDAFDVWARELATTGYLHNHARMWFASIWIFTLLLPWELGADFFMRHLLCGDPASNTLSWRWVAGLHTRGKTYLARRANIRAYTDGRLDVGDHLRSSAPARNGPAYPAEPLPELQRQPAVADPTLLLLHDDDAGVDSLPLRAYDIRASMALLAAAGRSPGALASGVTGFARAALADALTRAPQAANAGPRAEAHIVGADDIDAAAREIVARGRAAGASVVVTPFAPVGPVREALEALRPPLAREGVTLVEIGRPYDALAWPHATRGFFALREQIPAILSALQISQPASE